MAGCRVCVVGRSVLRGVASNIHVARCADTTLHRVRELLMIKAPNLTGCWRRRTSWGSPIDPGLQSDGSWWRCACRGKCLRCNCKSQSHQGVWDHQRSTSRPFSSHVRCLVEWNVRGQERTEGSGATGIREKRACEIRQDLAWGSPRCPFRLLQCLQTPWHPGRHPPADRLVQ